MSFTSLEKAVKAYHQHMPATEGQPLVLSSLPVGETHLICMPLVLVVLVFIANLSRLAAADAAAAAAV